MTRQPARDPGAATREELMAAKPHPGAFASIPTFMCGPGGCRASVAYEAMPEREVAGNLLEDIDDWVRAAQEHPDVPDGVRAAVLAAHEAVCGWLDWLDRERGAR